MHLIDLKWYWKAYTLCQTKISIFFYLFLLSDLKKRTPKKSGPLKRAQFQIPARKSVQDPYPISNLNSWIYTKFWAKRDKSSLYPNLHPINFNGERCISAFGKLSCNWRYIISILLIHLKLTDKTFPILCFDPFSYSCQTFRIRRPRLKSLWVYLRSSVHLKK